MAVIEQETRQIDGVGRFNYPPPLMGVCRSPPWIGLRQKNKWSQSGYFSLLSNLRCLSSFPEETLSWQFVTDQWRVSVQPTLSLFGLCCLLSYLRRPSDWYFCMDSPPGTTYRHTDIPTVGQMRSRAYDTMYQAMSRVEVLQFPVHGVIMALSCRVTQMAIEEGKKIKSLLHPAISRGRTLGHIVITN